MALAPNSLLKLSGRASGVIDQGHSTTVSPEYIDPDWF